MYLILIAWFYVALMMAVAEAVSPIGTVLGALVTFLLYGALPIGVLGYIMGSPARRRALQAQEAAASTAASVAPNADSETPRDTVASVREKP
ncbi:MAG: hypothetical protein ACR2IX_10785 [Limnohabitans sp.]